MDTHMHQLLEKLCRLSFEFLEQTAREIDEHCPRQFAEFVSAKLETFAKILPEKKNFSPIELADSLLHAMPLEHPAYHPDSLKKLELILNIYEKLDMDKGKEAFLLSEFSQAIETQMIRQRLCFYLSDLNRYKKRLTDIIDDKVKDERTYRLVLNRSVELDIKREEGSSNASLLADDSLTEDLK